MRNSAIRHPELSYFVMRRDWQVRALTKGKHDPDKPKPKKKDNSADCGAEILSIMEFHYNNRLANRMFKELVDHAMQKYDKHLAEVGDWIPYSNNYFQELLLNSRSQNVIKRALELLEKIGFISSDAPSDIRSFYNLFPNSWYKLNIEVINEWIDNNCKKTWIQEWQKTTKRKKRTARSPQQDLESATGPETEPEIIEIPPETQQFNELTALCGFYKYIHAKSDKYVFDNNRKGKISIRLKEKRSLGECAQAILGNVVSDFHQARHPNNMLGEINPESGIKGKVFDDIADHIFHTAAKFEKHIGYALEHGITEEIALEHFQGFLSGKPSSYAKKGVKTSQTNPDEPERAIQPELKYDPDTIRRYKEFARAISAFFISNLANADIIEMCKSNQSLERQGKGLVDAEYLTDLINNAMKVFRPNGLEKKITDQIAEFTKAFCKIQEINS